MSVGDLVSEEERPPYIQFEKRAIENKKESLRQGHYVGTDVDFVMVTTPGGRDVYENKAEFWLQQQEVYASQGRVKPEWVDMYHRAYEAWKKNEELPIDGTPIKGWQMLSPAQMKTVLGAGIRTVEDLAQSNDEAIRRLGMGGRDLINKAKSWLSTANESGKIAIQNAELKKENEVLKTTVESLQEKVDYLIAQHEQKQDVAEVTFRNDEPLGGNYVESDFSYKDTEPSLDELRQMYREKFNRKAHPRSKPEVLKQKLGL